MKQLSKHIAHYASLIGIFILALIGFYFFSYDIAFQMSIVLASAISYITWGVVHHAIHKDLYLTVFIEYLTVAIFCVTIVFSLILTK
jgi:hypothetical protein